MREEQKNQEWRTVDTVEIPVDVPVWAVLDSRSRHSNNLAVNRAEDPADVPGTRVRVWRGQCGLSVLWHRREPRGYVNNTDSAAMRSWTFPCSMIMLAPYIGTVIITWYCNSDNGRTDAMSFVMMGDGCLGKQVVGKVCTSTYIDLGSGCVWSFDYWNSDLCVPCYIYE